MKIKFWGVRGSIATSRKDQLWTGGNTSCIEITSEKDRLILDAGTGLKHLGDSLTDKKHHLLITHFHTDHICGLPFFAPLYTKSEVTIYAPVQENKSPQSILKQFFSPAFFPVPFEKLPAKIIVKGVSEAPFQIGSFLVRPFISNHPGSTRGYLIEAGGKKAAYFGDHEPIESVNHLKTQSAKTYHKKLTAFLNQCDLLIHDAHFFNEEYGDHKGWGHSSWNYPLELAQECQIKKLALFHHAPNHSDEEIKKNIQMLRSEKQKVILARDGVEIQL